MANNPFHLQNIQNSFDPQAFDDDIKGHGVTLVHWKAMYCPIGEVDLDDNRQPNDHSSHECSDGFLYTKAGTVKAILTTGGKTVKYEDVGATDGSTIQATIDRFYSDGRPFSCTRFDRFFLAETKDGEGGNCPTIIVETMQKFLFHETQHNRLKFPIVKIDMLADARGVFYQPGDYTIENGQIVWGSKNPGTNLDTGPGTQVYRGTVCAVRYWYRPYWFVGAIQHEIRVAQVEEGLNGDRKVTRMPFAVTLHREHVALNKDQPDDPSKGTPQDVQFPESPGFGPR